MPLAPVLAQAEETAAAPAREPLGAIHSEEVDEIIGQIPHWIVRWGISCIALVAVLALLAAWMIRYPEVIRARVTITTKSPPARVFARSSGRLAHILVQDNDAVVKRDQILAVIDNAAVLSDVQSLATFLSRAHGAGAGQRVRQCDLPGGRLGELEAAHAELVRRCAEWRLVAARGNDGERVAKVQAQIRSYERLAEGLAKQRATLGRDLELDRRRHQSYQSLVERKFLSVEAAAEAESTVLQKQAALERLNNEMLDNQVRVEQARRSILDLHYDAHERRSGTEAAVIEAVERLEAELAAWEQRYVLKAPVKGRVWWRYWSENQHVVAGEEVLSVVPEADALIGKVVLPEQNFGRIRVGQRVEISLDSLRASEVGVLRGRVDSLSPVPRDNQRLLDVALPDGLRTSFGVKAVFRPELQGDAQILTEELRLLERAFYQLRHLFVRVSGTRG